MKQLSPTDAMFYNMDRPHNPASIAVMWICDQTQAPDGVVRHKDVLEYLHDRIDSNSMFRRRLQKAPLSLDYPYWLDDDHFDMEYHVRHVGLPQPGDWRQLCIFTSRIMSRAMDNDRAPWEIYIIEGLHNLEDAPPRSFAVLIRLHHAYVDGKSGVELLTGLMTDTPEFVNAAAPVQAGEPAPGTVEMWARTIPNLVGQTAKSVKAAGRGVKIGKELITRLRGESKPDQGSSPRTRFTAKISPHRVYSSITWELADLQKMRPLHPGSSVNDVIISIVGGGMRRYLQKHGELPIDKSLTAVCPVSVRPAEASKDMGNMVSGMVVGIGTDVADPVKRLQLVQQRTTRGIPLARDVVFPLNDALNDLMPAYMHNLQSWVMQKLDLTSKFPSINTIVTNVPGPLGGKKYFAGARILKVHPVVPITDGIGVTHAITGLESILTMGVMSDRAIMQDIEFYIQCMQASTDEYLSKAKQLASSSANHKTAAKKSPARKKTAGRKKTATSARKLSKKKRAGKKISARAAPTSSGTKRKRSAKKASKKAVKKA